MRWFRRILLLFALLLAAYTVWPFLDLYRLARAVEQRDLAEVTRRVEFRGVRVDVTRQVFDTYLRLTGKEASLGPMGRDLVAGLGAALVEPALAEIASAEELLKLFAEGWPGSASDRPLVHLSKLPMMPLTVDGLWRLYAGADYHIDEFYVTVPPGAPSSQAFRLRMRLLQWRWKLYGIELPHDVRTILAQQMIKATEKK